MKDYARYRSFELDVVCWQDGKVVFSESRAFFIEGGMLARDVLKQFKEKVEGEFVEHYDRVQCVFLINGAQRKEFEFQRKKDPPLSIGGYTWRREFTQEELRAWYRRQFRCYD